MRPRFQFFVYPGPVAQQWSHIGWRHHNVHSPYFSGNQQYVGVVERRVQDTITVQLGAQFHSLPDVPRILSAPTHADGQNVPSDLQPTEPIVVTWQRSASWTEALRPLELPFMYVAAWTLLLSRSEHLRKQ